LTYADQNENLIIESLCVISIADSRTEPNGNGLGGKMAWPLLYSFNIAQPDVNRRRVIICRPGDGAGRPKKKMQGAAARHRSASNHRAAAAADHAMPAFGVA
jgi:hypothetical protein